MKTTACQSLVGLVLIAGSAMASTVATEPLKAFSYQPQKQSTPPVFTSVPVTSRLDSSLLAPASLQLSDRDLRNLDVDVTAPKQLNRTGLYSKTLPDGSQLTAIGPSAPYIPGDPHGDIARFTLLGVNW